MRPCGRRTPVEGARRPRSGRMLARALAVGTGLVWVLWPGNGLTHVTTTNTVVFEREIAGILRRHCADCHAPGRPGVPLMSYEDVWLAREDVLASVLTRRMPPWAAVAGYGEFANENALTLREKQFLVSWVEGLGPRNAGEVFLNVPGSAGDTEAAAPGTGGEAWELGEPALVLELPESASRGGTDGGGRGPHPAGRARPAAARGLGAQRRRIPAGRPGIGAGGELLSRADRTLARQLDTLAPRHAPSPLCRAHAPGRRPGGGRDPLRAGRRRRRRRGEDRPPSHRRIPGDQIAGGRDPPRGAWGHTRRRRTHAEATVGGPVRILALLPRRRRGVRSIEVSARLPDGRTEILLLAQDLPYGWPTPYLLAEPVQLEDGSTLRATAYYENADPAAAVLRVAVSAF